MKPLHSTQVIGVFVDWGKIPDQVLANACRRGSVVHLACSSYVKLGYNLPLHGPVEWNGYFDSFKKWFNENVYETILIEHRMMHPVYNYTGQIDFVFRLSTNEVVLTDIKTPLAESKTWKAQLASYDRLLIDCEHITVDDIMSLRLNPDGKEAKGVRYGGDRASHFNVFLSALNAYRNLK